MKTAKMCQRLVRLDREATRLRQKLRFSEPNKLLYRSFTSSQENWFVVVEADGHGGAWTSMVEGRFPFDYQVFYEKHFETETEALRVAEDVVQHSADPDQVLQPGTAIGACS